MLHNLKDFEETLLFCNILVYVLTKDNEDMQKFPTQAAYNKLEASISKAIERYNFPIADYFIAHE